MQNRKLVNFRESRQFNTRHVSLTPCSKPSVSHEMLRCAAMYSAFKMHLFIRNHLSFKQARFFFYLYNTVRKVTVNNYFRNHIILTLVHWQHFKRLSTFSVSNLFFAFSKNQFTIVEM